MNACIAYNLIWPNQSINFRLVGVIGWHNTITVSERHPNTMENG